MSKTSSQVASSLLLPDGWAYLDWITGMIRIDSNRTDWERLKEKVPPNKRLTAHMLTEDELTLLETFTHEMVHYLQLCTTGYLYRLARDLLAVLAELPPASTIDDVPEADLTRAAGRLRAIKEERLCAPGKRGLDVISLVESAAFLVQKRTHYDLTPADYEAALVGWPAMYRAGYDIAREHLGDEAFECYPLLASLSLWTGSPVDTFFQLCEGLASLSPARRREIQFGHLVDAVTKSPEFVGPPWPGGQRRNFPEFEVAIRKFDGVERQRFLCRPYDSECAGPLIEAAGPLIVLNEDNDARLCVTTPLSWSGKTEVEKTQIAQMSLLLFAISTHLQRSALAAPGPSGASAS